MSAPAPPERPLDAARRHLAGRGYLRPNLAGMSQPRWRPWLAALAIAGLLALVLGGEVVAGTRAEPALLLPFAVAFLPFCLLGVALARVIGGWLGRALLGMGGEPRVLASALAGAGGLAVMTVLVAFAERRWRGGGVALLAAWAAGGALAALVMVAGRRALLRELSYRSPATGSRMGALFGVLMAAVLVAGAGMFVAARRHAEPPEEPVGAFPPARGRLAVLAVDGLAREDFASLGASPKTPAAQAIAGWGWAALTGLEGHLPSVAWTTIACSVPPAVHGVEELDEVRLFGARDGLPLAPLPRALLLAVWQPLGAAQVLARPALSRQAPTFWEMASRAGCPVTVGGWWGSWPIRRVLGEVASERAWLGGATDADAVTAGLAPLVRQAWSGGGGATTASDRLAEELARRAAGTTGPRLVAIAMPALDLTERASLRTPPLALAERLAPHLAAVVEVARLLEHAGLSVWIVGVPWHGGTPFVATSSARGERPDVSALELASTWLDALGLPSPAGSPMPRRDLSGVVDWPVSRAHYGPSPPPLLAPSPAALSVQRDVLRNLGYLE